MAVMAISNVSANLASHAELLVENDILSLRAIRFISTHLANHLPFDPSTF